MAAHELSRNCATRHCVFAIDTENDLKILPTSKKSGKESVSLSTPCRQGSMARSVDGKCYILNGNDEWKYSFIGTSGSSSGGNGNTSIEDVEPIPSDTIESLFG